MKGSHGGNEANALVFILIGIQLFFQFCGFPDDVHAVQIQ
jgi:hypothetical protein